MQEGVSKRMSTPGPLTDRGPLAGVELGVLDLESEHGRSTCWKKNALLGKNSSARTLLQWIERTVMAMPPRLTSPVSTFHGLCPWRAWSTPLISI